MVGDATSAPTIKKLYYLPYQGYSHIYNIQLMTFDEMNTRIDQPMEHDIHRVIR